MRSPTSTDVQNVAVGVNGTIFSKPVTHRRKLQKSRQIWCSTFCLFTRKLLFKGISGFGLITQMGHLRRTLVALVCGQRKAARELGFRRMWRSSRVMGS